MAAYKVQQSTSVGRFVVAGKTLSAGEEILSEEPFAIGPKAFSYVLCLGCYAPLQANQLCDKCSWPICSAECSENIWHKENECKVFSKCGVKFQESGDETAQLSCITPLRVLLSSERNPERWNSEVLGLEGHLASRRGGQDWQAEQVNVFNFLGTKCQLDRFGEELFEKVCGILEVNSFEVVTTSGSIRGLYPRSALLNHNCVANTTHSIDPANNYRIVLRTTVGVAEGRELSCSYTSCFHPTLVRRARLREHKYFSCTCQRCSDPTELGTNIGTLKCTKCDNGVITSTNPLDDQASWKCSHCENGVTGEGARRVFEALQADLDQLENMEEGSRRLEATEKVLRGFKSVLHPHNGYNAMLWHSLSTLYGHTDGYTLDMLPDLLLERKSKFCKDLLDLLNVIEPGYTRTRGLTLYEYQVSLLMYARSQFQRGGISAELLRKVAQEVMGILEECATILSLEPPSTPEAFLANVARQSAVELQESLAQLS